MATGPKLPLIKKNKSAFRDRMVSLQSEIYRRNQQRIHAAVLGDNKEFEKYESKYRSSLPKPRQLRSFDELLERFRAADVIYLGDYHTLEQAQRSMVRILRGLVPFDRKIALAVEFVEGRHQAALDAFLARRIGEKTFLRRIEYKKHWPYGSFDGPMAICELARNHNIPMYGIDRDARRGATLAARDKYAAQRIVSIRKQDPDTQVFCLIGELHLAPAHLPQSVAKCSKTPVKQFTIHQNPERVYHALEASGLEQEAEVVELTRNRFALNVVPPIICQQSFLRWLEEDDTYQDTAHLQQAFRQQLQLIGKLLDIESSEALDNVQIETFADLSFFDRLSNSGDFNEAEILMLRQQIINSDSYYIPRAHLVYLGTPSVNHSSEEAAHFLRHVVAGETQVRHPIEAFYDRAVNEALAFFCSKLVNNKRKTMHESAFRRLLKTSRDTKLKKKDRPTPFEVQQALRVIEHKRLERAVKKADSEMIFRASPRLLDAVAHSLGYMLGDRLYYAVIRGVLDKSVVRSVFLDPLETTGAAIATYFALSNEVANVKIPRRV